jgi:hypothetical protein
MKRLKVFLILLTVLSGNLFLFSNAYGQTANYPGPFKGRVVDQDTNQPIEGTVVHVDWHLNHMFSRPTYFDTKEVLTDKNGDFYIPWAGSIFIWRNLFISSNFILFKSDYGNIDGYYGENLRLIADQHRQMPEEIRKKIGPGAYFNIRFEGDLPIFLLKKISKEEAAHNFPSIYLSLEAPARKRRLILEEFNKQRRSLGAHELEIK